MSIRTGSSISKGFFHLNCFQEDHRKNLLFMILSDFFLSFVGIVDISNKVFTPADTVVLLKI